MEGFREIYGGGADVRRVARLACLGERVARVSVRFVSVGFDSFPFDRFGSVRAIVAWHYTGSAFLPMEGYEGVAEVWRL